ncbi:MAG: FtsQ-type POTRA domain-containing protein [Gammaproteobacteria bacterium]|nr:FtsQ-type POTRA domain-containing protein [Gammaproteobacteria bacterium]
MSAQLLVDSVTDEVSPSMTRQQPDSLIEPGRPLLKYVFAALLVLIVGIIFQRLLDPLTLPIKQVRIEGNFQHLSNEKMRDMVSAVIKGGFFNLNVMSIKEELLSEAWVEQVIVRRVWPDGLNVLVKEQIPVAIWNQTSLLNNESVVFTPSPLGPLTGIPSLIGPDKSEEIVHQRYLQLSEALRGKARIEELLLNDRRAWKLKLVDGPLVILGRSSVDLRIDRFTGSVLSSLGDDLSKVKQIDLRYTNGFAIQRLENYETADESGLGKNG